MLNFIKHISRFLIGGIIVVMSLILFLAFLDILYVIWEKVITPPILIIDANELMSILSIFLLLLIGLELLETVKTYLKEDVVHVEFIVLVAITAVARKAIVWDFKKYTTEELISLAIIILSLGITYFLVKKADVKIQFNPRRKTKDMSE